MAEEGMTYKDAGVDVDLGNVCSKIMYEASKKTWKNREGKIGWIKEQFSDFSGARSFEISGLGKTYANLNFDGVGTKMEVAERMMHATGNAKYHKGIAYDLFAMVCDDAVVRGAEPAVVGNVLDVDHLNKDMVQALADGMVEAADAAGVAVVNGEIAELPGKVGGYGGQVGANRYALEWIRSNAFGLDNVALRHIVGYVLQTDIKQRKEIRKINSHHEDFCEAVDKMLYNPVYNWSAALFWAQEPDKVITGKKAEPGMQIVALEEKGFGSNGLSLVRKILKKEHDDDWHMQEYNGKPIGEHVLTPCKIYSKAVMEMHGKTDLAAVAHITGGGIPEKLGRALKPSRLGAELTDLFEPCALMKYCQKTGGTNDAEAYQTWNMGQRMMVITNDTLKAIEIADKHGIHAKTVGKVIAEPVVKIYNKGFHKKEDILVYEIE